MTGFPQLQFNSQLLQLKKPTLNCNSDVNEAMELNKHVDLYGISSLFREINRRSCYLSLLSVLSVASPSLFEPIAIILNEFYSTE